ncbi:MAG: vWA domain-containing protein, partial [Pseudomonadota bacterium]
QDHSCEDQDTAKYDGQSQKPASRRKEMTCDNRLFLRALSRPEFDFKPRKHPVDGDIISEFSLGVLKHLWRYVYAVEEIEGQLWYLLGHSSNFTVKRNIIETDVNTTKDAQDTLLGWIPKYEVTEWATNVALEYNTDNQPLTERFNDNQPARIYANQRQDAPVLAEESLALAQHAVRDGRKDDDLQVRFDPFGLDPMLPRYYVKGFNEKTGWYKVATIGTSKLTLSDEQMRAIMTKLRSLIDDLRAVDLVFVVDRSNSMANVIAEVRTFLDELCKLISEKRRESHFVIQTAGGGQSISTSLDIRVSMVAYAEESETIFSQIGVGKSLGKTSAAIGGDGGG